jgi:hypothetical protein
MRRSCLLAGLGLILAGMACCGSPTAPAASARIVAIVSPSRLSSTEQLMWSWTLYETNGVDARLDTAEVTMPDVTPGRYAIEQRIWWKSSDPCTANCLPGLTVPAHGKLSVPALVEHFYPGSQARSGVIQSVLHLTDANGNSVTVEQSGPTIVE